MSSVFLSSRYGKNEIGGVKGHVLVKAADARREKSTGISGPPTI
jgi:hypothetical protein